MPDASTLGMALRERRERTRPEQVGVVGHGRRRTGGLRREELAELAGVSTDHLKRMEQGRRHPSPGVLNALARALRVSRAEYEHLCTLAGYAPVEGQVPRRLSPGARRLVERVESTPVCVLDATWTVVGWNQAWETLACGVPSLHPREGNIPWRVFVGQDGRVMRSPGDHARFQRLLVAELRAASTRYPADDDLASLTAELQRASAVFAELWASTPTAGQHDSRMLLQHEDLGQIALDCDTVHIPDGDLRAVVFTADPGSVDADAVADDEHFGR
ncbi:helix-turn-helix domain-containing protein [Amycolatopsis azurea]|uniref:Transcriptional regulator n=1 Tax=Amycolatopsis azurea DSM 43854 TaxID=1238180 RepID=A0ABX3J2K2_9PSEU|nr:helix-turn-helix domain-containing protein [Amycolatopsis azurea]OOC01918.1 transcriptional regulator [Amycolatopsis azurea DSM 43854]